MSGWRLVLLSTLLTGMLPDVSRSIAGSIIRLRIRETGSLNHSMRSVCLPGQLAHRGTVRLSHQLVKHTESGSIGSIGSRWSCGRASKCINPGPILGGRIPRAWDEVLIATVGVSFWHGNLSRSDVSIPQTIPWLPVGLIQEIACLVQGDKDYPLPGLRTCSSHCCGSFLWHLPLKQLLFLAW